MGGIITVQEKQPRADFRCCYDSKRGRCSVDGGMEVTAETAIIPLKEDMALQYRGVRYGSSLEQRKQEAW